MQGYSSKKSDIKVRAAFGAKVLRGDIRSFYRIKCAKRAPRIPREFKLPIDLSRQYGLVISIVHNQHWSPWKIVCQLGAKCLSGKKLNLMNHL